MNVSVACIAINEKKVFIARRLGGGDMGGVWEFPGGKVDDGEPYEESVAREFFEEFGVKIKCGEMIGESSFVNKGVKRLLKAYIVYFDDINNLNLTLTDHSEWLWADIQTIKTLDFTPSDLALLPFVEDHL
jgi:8-oxo-dGTP diphosphatase